MKRYPFVLSALAIGAVFAGMCLAAAPSKEVTAASDEQSVLQSDRAFVECRNYRRQDDTRHTR